MLNLSFLACTKVELKDLTICILVNRESFEGLRDLDLDLMMLSF